LDPGSSEQWRDRTLEGVRTHQEAIDVHALPKVRHWYRTHELALTLLHPFRPDLAIDTVSQYFAHTNSAKCCTNNPHRRLAARTLFTNCRAYIPGELQRLRPDILVTQGDLARVAVKAAAPPFTIISGAEFFTVVIDGREVLWFHSYHPRNFGRFNKQRREDFGRWALVAYQRLRRAA
jgi:uracil-DNA glycosylase